MSTMEGKTINGYTLKHQLGVGGMAEVWLAENALGKKAAVKLLLSKFCDDESVRSRFYTEAKVMVELNHPYIRQVYDLDELDGRPAIIMEYLEGDDLKALMKQGRRFTDEELKQWWNQLVDALNYTHARDVVHRDIKPSNIFIDLNGDVKLLDFGIAKVADTTSGTMTGSTLGTRIYMSPEQVKDPKRVDYRTDLYSLAVTFVHLLTGKAPYDSTTTSDFEIQACIVSKPVNLSLLPEEWQAFLAPYLEKDPDKRPELRYFETVGTPSYTKPTPNEEPFEDEDEGTVVSETEQKKPTSPNAEAPLSSGTSPKNKNKSGLWIGLGIAAILLLVILFTFNKKDDTPTYQSYQRESTTSQPTNSNEMTINVNGVSFVMKKVEGSSFNMGSYDDDAADEEQPVHGVTISTFYMAETEVTQALWEAVMGENPSKYVGNNLPVDQVSWNDCQSFIKKLNNLTGKKFRLPTEAEWEFAARGGNKSGSYKYSGSNYIGSVAWYDGNSGNESHPVKTKSPNELGLYDMSGNVWEFCSDWMDSYDDYRQIDPTGPSSGTYRVVRGGGWNRDEYRCRVSYRGRYTTNDRHFSNGLRLAMTD